MALEPAHAGDARLDEIAFVAQREPGEHALVQVACQGVAMGGDRPDGPNQVADHTVRRDLSLLDRVLQLPGLLGDGLLHLLGDGLLHLLGGGLLGLLGDGLLCLLGDGLLCLLCLLGDGLLHLLRLLGQLRLLGDHRRGAYD